MTSKSESVSGSHGSVLDHLALAIEAATNLKTQDILLPVGVAREILHKFQTYVSPPPNPPPIVQHLCSCGIYLDRADEAHDHREPKRDSVRRRI